jgi:RHS repeat-associated protein
LRAIGEKFTSNPATGVGEFTVAVPISPARAGGTPALALSWQSAQGNGDFGLGWQIPAGRVQRKTDDGIPRYADGAESDVFTLSDVDDLVRLRGADGSLVADDLSVAGFAVRRYRPRTEGSFTRIERWTRLSDGDVHWRTLSGENLLSVFGRDAASRVADPHDASRVFSWLLCQIRDDVGNAIIYDYKPEDATGVDTSSAHERARGGPDAVGRAVGRHLKSVSYGNVVPLLDANGRRPVDPTDDALANARWMFQVVLDYGEHDADHPLPTDSGPWGCRDDPFSSYRAGFEIRNYRLCRRILVFHHFPDEPGVGADCLVRSLDLEYAPDPRLSLLTSVSQRGYVREGDAYAALAMPPVRFGYSAAVISTEVQELDADSAANLPAGVDGAAYSWVDLDGEGLAGVLSQQAGEMFYKPNLGGGQLGATRTIPLRPQDDPSLAPGMLRLLDLDSDGALDLTRFAPPAGYFTRTDGWTDFAELADVPVLDWSSPNVELVDLTGDGLADVLATEDGAFTWHESLALDGYGPGQRVALPPDEDLGPKVVLADGSQTIFLADMSGDGLTDLVRIRQDEICYWPNLGYGQFGAKVVMDDAPVFDAADRFDSGRLRLVDIDGSGTVDLLYVGSDGVTFAYNQSGNSWGPLQALPCFPTCDDAATVRAADLLGNGTACLVWSTMLPTESSRAVRYVDLMGGTKPHLLTSVDNGTGGETLITYGSSTQAYLADARTGTPWVTKLPFPVHVVTQIEHLDHVSGTRLISLRSYHHGYFDGREREFRGFGRIDQTDAEEYGAATGPGQDSSPELAQAPVTTRTWFHTGAYLPRRSVVHPLRAEYFGPDEPPLLEPPLPDGLSDSDLRDAVRSLRDSVLRVEVFSFDGTAQAGLPYSTIEHSYEVRLLQPGVDVAAAVCLPLSVETIGRHYERVVADPRTEHTLAIELDPLGYPVTTATVAYGRRNADPGLPAEVSADQQTVRVMISGYAYTPDIDVSVPAPAYRCRRAYDARSEELTGVRPAAALFTLDELGTALAGAAAIPFETVPSGALAQRRLVARSQTRFRDESLAALPAGQWDSRGLLHQGYRLALTDGLVTENYGATIGTTELTAAGYVHLDGDADWWVPSGVSIYSADPAAHFFRTIGTQDALGLMTIATFDAYDLLVTAVQTGTEGWNVTTAHSDYRTLSATLVTDPNGNRRAVRQDPLGIVVATAVMGKDGDADGDTLDDPTSRVTYDPLAWTLRQQPIVIHTYGREQFGADNPRWQESYIYCDGSGNIALVKSQTGPGPAAHVAADGEITQATANPRWIGTGRTVLNNKGNPVKQYEPYFSDTSDFDTEAALREFGATPVIHYDAIGRRVRTEAADGTTTAAATETWRSLAWDANDAVLDSPWYIARGSPDPTAEPEPADPDRRAAWLSARYANTPAVTHFDNLGRAIYAVTDLGGGSTTAIRTVRDTIGSRSTLYDQRGRVVSSGFSGPLGLPIVSSTAELGSAWGLFDALGRCIRNWNSSGRTTTRDFDRLSRPLSTRISEGAGPEVVVSYVVYGDRAPNAATGNLLGAVHQVFDTAGRVEVPSVDFVGNPTAVGRRVPADYTRTPDWSGVAAAANYTDVQTAAALVLENESFTASATYDALGRTTAATLPDGTVLRPTYDEGNEITSLQAQISGQGAFVDYLTAQTYDAKGMRLMASHGNGVTLQYSYDPKSFRLTNLTALPPGGVAANSLQNLSYVYDAAGNVVHIADGAQQLSFFANAVVSADSNFAYDATNQLVSATGRELVGGNDVIRANTDLDVVLQLPHVNDAAAVRNYVETYTYDDLGNITTLRHGAAVGNGSWTRHYQYAYDTDATNPTNRLVATSAPGDPDAGPYTVPYDYDARGNLSHLRLPDPGELTWDVFDHLVHVDLGGGGDVYYVHDAEGQRVRKTVVRQGGRVLDHIYLGPLEIYRERDGASAPDLERHTVHIGDDAGAIAQVDVKIKDDKGLEPTSAIGQAVARYRYGNLIGSAMVETDGAGAVITYEEYHPYGTTSYRSAKPTDGATLKLYRFAARERDDETGLYSMGARQYAPWLGRWISPDPAGFGDGPNLYVYCRNNPVMRHDPNGTQSAPQQLVPITAENRRLASPAMYDEAKAYLEGVFTQQQGAAHPGQRAVITQMRWNGKRWEVGALDWQDVAPPDASGGSDTAGDADAANGGSDAGTDAGQAESADAGTAADATGSADSGSADARSHDPAGSAAREETHGTTTTTTPDAGSGSASDAGTPANRSVNGSADGSATGSANGRLGGTGSGAGAGSGSGGGGGSGERSFWSRGGRTLLLGLGILALGLLTVLTGGGALVMFAAGMAIGAGAATAIGSGILLAASYSGHTTAEQDARWQGALHDAGLFASSPGSVIGGTIGAIANGREGLRTGSMIGGLTEGVISLGVGVGRMATMRAGSGLAEPVGEVTLSQWRQMTTAQREVYELGQVTVRNGVWKQIEAMGIEGNPMEKGRFLLSLFGGGSTGLWGRALAQLRAGAPWLLFKTAGTGGTPMAAYAGSWLMHGTGLLGGEIGGLATDQ